MERVLPRVALGFTLQPDEEFLARTAPLLRFVDYAEVAPETLWRVQPDGAVVDNGFVDVIAGLVHDAALFCVAHGVGLSMAAVDDDPARLALWQRRLADNHARFQFAWMSDHGGLTTTKQLHLALPVPVPPTARRARCMSAKQHLLADICGGPGLVEVSSHCFTFGAAVDDAALYRACCDDDRAGLLLDVHNVFTMAQNLGFDVRAFIRSLPMHRVVEIHVSGGKLSPPGFLPQGQVRLDSHDDDVTDDVFALLAFALPLCPRLRGVTLERMEGTVDDQSLPRLAFELQTIRRLLDDARPGPHAQEEAQEKAGALHDDDDDLDDDVYASTLLADDAHQALGKLGFDVDEAGARTAKNLIAKLRFERLMNGDRAAAAAFDDDPAAFARVFRRYHQSVLPTAWHPRGEAELFSAFVAAPPDPPHKP